VARYPPAPRGLNHAAAAHVRIGFVGAGAVVGHHLAVLAGQPDVEIAAVCDVDEQRAQAVAAGVGARPYLDWAEMLAREQLDALFVCVPPTLHAPAAVAALERGLATYLEKPLARTLADGEAIVAAWRASGTVCAVGYQWRSLDVLEDLRAALGGAAPGMLISRSMGPTEGARGDLAHTGPGRPASWFTDPRTSGGILFELGSHDVDLQLALAGPATSVQASAGRGLLAVAGRSSDLDDAIAILLRFEGGGIGAVHVAWSDAGRAPVYSLDVLAPEIALHLELDPVLELRGRARGAEIEARASVGPRVSSVSRFLAAVRSGDADAVPCSPADALGTLSVLLACETAIASGERVALV
jgi:myo-inositol 2-dehydrogenase / D-chiro-inositol 1-dehydrogenase